MALVALQIVQELVEFSIFKDERSKEVLRWRVELGAKVGIVYI